MKPDIIIPTNKTEGQLWRQLKALRETAPGCRVIRTGYSVSAATNRNWGLYHAGPVVIEVDDDIVGFFPGWAEKLIEPLSDPSVVMVSARLMNANGTPGVMMNIIPNLKGDIVEVPDRVLPSACVAYRNDGTYYDEAYLGAGFEDTDHCMQLGQKYPEGKWLIHNGVKLVHKNEMKGQRDRRFVHNREYYLKKWNLG